jgi:hypothetical protein
LGWSWATSGARAATIEFLTRAGQMCSPGRQEFILLSDTMVEVEEIVEAGGIDPDAVHTPGIFVDRIVKSTINEKRIEKLTVRQRTKA